MSGWGFAAMMLFFALLSIAFALTIIVLFHGTAWIFKLGRRTAKKNPWNNP